MNKELVQVENQTEPVASREEARKYRKPVYEINQHEDRYELRVLLPGVGRDEVKLEVKGDLLRLHTERNLEVRPGDRSLYRERYRGDYWLELHLGRGIDGSLIQAHSQDGVLKITLQKSREAMGRTIEIQ